MVVFPYGKSSADGLVEDLPHELDDVDMPSYVASATEYYSTSHVDRDACLLLGLLADGAFA
jgi:hypothetical protein